VNNFTNDIIPESRLTCERGNGHGHVRTLAGRHPCLNCSTAANGAWIPASQPPVCEPNAPPSHSILYLGAVAFDGGLMHDLVAYWPARDRWTATRLDGMERADIEVEVSHYQELPACRRDWRAHMNFLNQPATFDRSSMRMRAKLLPADLGASTLINSSLSMATAPIGGLSLAFSIWTSTLHRCSPASQRSTRFT
jgi:hypothetical protein